MTGKVGTPGSSKTDLGRLVSAGVDLFELEARETRQAKRLLPPRSATRRGVSADPLWGQRDPSGQFPEAPDLSGLRCRSRNAGAGPRDSVPYAPPDPCRSSDASHVPLMS
jgi:hypothetical protein